MSHFHTANTINGPWAPTNGVAHTKVRLAEGHLWVKKWSEVNFSKVVPGPFGVFKQVVYSCFELFIPILGHATSHKVFKRGKKCCVDGTAARPVHQELQEPVQSQARKIFAYNLHSNEYAYGTSNSL